MTAPIKLRNFIFLTAIFITGCTPSFVELRQDKLHTSYTSKKPAKEIADCILSGWQKDTNSFTNYGEIYMQPYKNNGFSIFSHGRIELADIYPEGKITKINFYYHGGFKYRIENKLSVMEACR